MFPSYGVSSASRSCSDEAEVIGHFRDMSPGPVEAVAARRWTGPCGEQIVRAMQQEMEVLGVEFETLFLITVSCKTPHTMLKAKDVNAQSRSHACSHYRRESVILCSCPSSSNTNALTHCTQQAARKSSFARLRCVTDPLTAPVRTWRACHP